MNLASLTRKYIVPALVPAVMGCSVVQYPSSSLEKKIAKTQIPTHILLRQKEKELGESSIKLAGDIRKDGQCVVYEAGKIYVCRPIKKTFIDKDVLLRRIVYNNTKGDQQYDSLDIYVGPPSFPKLESDSLKRWVIEDVENRFHVDLESKRLLYIKISSGKVTFSDFPYGKKETHSVECFNVLFQKLPHRNGECVYPLNQKKEVIYTSILFTLCGTS